MRQSSATSIRYVAFLVAILSVLVTTGWGFSTAPKPSMVGRTTQDVTERQQQQQPEVAAQPDNKFASSHAAAFVAAAAAFAPAIAIAAEENYEYGTVNAPPLIPIVGGILAILTATLPVFLRSGEEAFDEIREREQETFGSKGNKDVLKRRK